MDPLVQIFHALCFLVYSFGLYFDHYKVAIPSETGHHVMTYQVIGGRWKYLTYINLVLQCVFFGVCFLNDFLGSETLVANRRSALQKVRDGVVATVVVPLGVFVPLVFWGLYAVDRNLIFPASMDAWFPTWLNHLMHTLPLFAALLEIVTVNHVYPRGRNLYFPIVVISAIYVAWICFIAYHAGMWVYPVFEVLDFKSRAAFMACLIPPNLLFVFLGQKLHMTVWGAGKGPSRRRGKKDKSQ
ncbi:Androgen-induced 1 protein [Chionoecetes opilio]|uniref:Androgen-induced 1 protein n=1 Tax=Chionoecetes opilio TaxID=41210 RepID=A0A8J4XMX4_CHIOP|nr:Androgen-induced 1 protein [Chionoecetes opilio]